jgi:hypothetical protein
MRVRLNFITTLFWAVYALLILSTPRSADAAEWSVQPSVRVGQEYNDNPVLTVDPHNSVRGSMISPKLDLGMSSDIWQITGDMEAVQKRFSGNSGLNRDDQFYNLTASYQTERSTWQVAGSTSKSSTIAEEQISPDTGAVQFPVAYDTHSINPSWVWAVNELTQLQLIYSFTDVSYVNGQTVGFHDYTSRGVSAQLTKQYDPQNQIFFSAGYSIFNVPSTTLESKSATYQAGIIRVFSETLRGTLTAGARQTSDEQIVLVCTLSFGPFCFQTANEARFAKQTSSVFNGSLDKTYETTRFKITFSRAFDPSGLGGQVRTDSQEAWLSRQFTARLKGYLSAANYEYKSETGNLSGIDRHYYMFEPGLQWLWTQELSADLSYRYRHIKRADEDNPATSRSAYLTLKYAWPKMSFSR